MYKYGVIGPGNVAALFAGIVATLPDSEIVAVCSRSLDKALAYSQLYGPMKCYDDYDAFLADKNIDAVYVATPHAQHYEYARAALLAGKPVLCEKAFTVNAREARDLVLLSRQRKLPLMEIMWERYLPAVKMIKEEIKAGAIGDIVACEVNLCVSVPFNASERYFAPEAASSALLDLGVYCISPVWYMLGQNPRDIKGFYFPTPVGTDMTDSFVVAYETCACTVNCTLAADSKGRGVRFIGTKGVIFAPDHPFIVEYTVQNEEGARTERATANTGHSYPISEFNALLEYGGESEVMPLDESVRMMELLDVLRADWGLTYKNDRQE